MTGPKDFDGRRRRYVPMDVHLAFGTFGTRLLDKWGMDGLCTWMLFLAACKREPNEGTFTYTTDDEAWGKLGARPAGELTLDTFWTFTGQQKKTSRRRHGRITYIVCTRWEGWNTPRIPPQKTSKTQENTTDIPPEYVAITTPEAEAEGESDPEHELELRAAAFQFDIPLKVEAVNGLVTETKRIDDGYRRMLTTEFDHLPPAAFFEARSELIKRRSQQPNLANECAYVRRILERMVAEGQYANGAAA